MKSRITILGGGESGLGAAILAKHMGLVPFVSDQGMIARKNLEEFQTREIAFEQGKHSARVFEADEIVKSPGIPDNAEVVQTAQRKGIPVISEIEFASRHTSSRLIAITGTNGKTTTTLLVYHILKELGFSVGVAGNIGKSFAREITETNYEWYVVEVSSFQLDGIDRFKPEVAVLLNITPDHLDRYEGSIDQYAASKFRICLNQDMEDHFITYADAGIIESKLADVRVQATLYKVSLSEEIKLGAYVEGNQLVFNVEGGTTAFNLDTLKNLALRGPHNSINVMAAMLAVKAAGAELTSSWNCLNTFRNVPHRMEYVEDIDGVAYINDSKGTNLDAVKVAMQSFEEPIIWLMGGIDKGNEYQSILPLVKEKVKAMVLIGVDNEKITQFFGIYVGLMPEADSMQAAVRVAHDLGRPGDVVLLSPACSSFDRFKNYEDRGDQFKEAVRKLKMEVA
jgi:UDP-N-acetylmuramoylalanine--D-glutamate ligase